MVFGGGLLYGIVGCRVESVREKRNYVWLQDILVVDVMKFRENVGAHELCLMATYQNATGIMFKSVADYRKHFEFVK